jgi:hypothetical protein
MALVKNAALHVAHLSFLPEKFNTQIALIAVIFQQSKQQQDQLTYNNN